MNTIEATLNDFENILKKLSPYEKKGLDTSSLRLFIKNLKVFYKIQCSRENKIEDNISFDEKLNTIKLFLEDKNAFPKISDIIYFVINEIAIEFKDQKQSRVKTIEIIIDRIARNPELKEKVKESARNIRNQKAHLSNSSHKSKNETDSIESFAKWAEILSKL